MIGNVTMEQPRPDIVWLHIDDLCGSGKNFEGVDATTQNGISMPMNGVSVVIVAKSDHVPSGRALHAAS